MLSVALTVIHNHFNIICQLCCTHKRNQTQTNHTLIEIVTQEKSDYKYIKIEQLPLAS